MIYLLCFFSGVAIAVIIMALCFTAKCADCEIELIHHRMEGIQSDEATQKETELADLLCQQQCPVRCTREEV